MAVANLTLYLNITTQTLQASASGAIAFQIPALTTYDTVNLRVSLIEQTGSGPSARYSTLDISPLSLKVSIGTRGGTPDVQQTSFSVSGSFLVGTLDLSAAGFISKVTAGTQLYFEIKVGQGGVFTTYYNAAVAAQLSVAAAGTTTTPGADSYLTAVETAALYVPYVIPAGRTVIFRSADGLATCTVGCNNDGSLMANPGN